MTSGINGRCDRDCPLGRHHRPDCVNYRAVWRTCPCDACATQRIVEGVANPESGGMGERSHA